MEEASFGLLEKILEVTNQLLISWCWESIRIYILDLHNFISVDLCLVLT